MQGLEWSRCVVYLSPSQLCCLPVSLGQSAAPCYGMSCVGLQLWEIFPCGLNSGGIANVSPCPNHYGMLKQLEA